MCSQHRGSLITALLPVPSALAAARVPIILAPEAVLPQFTSKLRNRLSTEQKIVALFVYNAVWEVLSLGGCFVAALKAGCM
jgi:hypothetical protein